MTHTVLVSGMEPVIAKQLSQAGLFVTNTKAETVSKVRDELSEGKQEALIFGMNSKFDGDAVECLRSQQVTIPIMSIQSGPKDRLWVGRCANFLDSGGDNVLVGPSDPEEVLYAVRTAIRRASIQPPNTSLFRHGGDELFVHHDNKRVYVSGREVFLTRHEFIVLACLARLKRTVALNELYDTLFQMDDSNRLHGNVVEVFICRIRKKLGKVANLLVTIKKVGYKLIEIPT